MSDLTKLAEPVAWRWRDPVDNTVGEWRSMPVVPIKIEPGETGFEYDYAYLSPPNLAAELAEANKWREAVIDALVVSCIYTAEHDANPRKAINDLLAWESQIALDPAVSSDAQALIDQGRADLAEVKKERDTLRTSTDELRRAIADLIGADPETWPNHGNAPLAIAAGFALAQNRAEKAEAELAEMRRLYKGVCDACEIATNAGIAQRERAEKAEAALAKIESICTACVNRSGHIVTVLNNIEAAIRGAKE